MIKLTRRLLVIVAVFASLSMTAAWAYWTTNGFGFGTGNVDTLAAPTGVGSSYSSTTGAITVNWTGVTPPSGDATQVGYYVRRDATNVCGSPSSLLASTAVSCADTDAPGGSYTHTVTAVFRSWTSNTSSSTVGVTPSVAIASGQSVPVGGTISATLHGFQSSDTITFNLDSASGTPITTPASVSTPAGSGSATATLMIPAGATAGTHAIYAAGLGGAADSAATANTFSIPSSAATHLVVSGFPASVTAGTDNGFTVTAKDASGDVATGYLGTVAFTTDDPQVTSVATGLPANYTFVAGDAGSHTVAAGAGFTLTTASPSVTVTATDLSNSSITGTQGSITVVAAALDSFGLTNPGLQTAGSAFTTTLTALDAYGNAASGWTSTSGCVTFSGPLSSPNGTAPLYPAQGPCSTGQSNLTFNADGHAPATVSLFRASSSTSITATSGTTQGSTGTFSVNSKGVLLAYNQTSPLGVAKNSTTSFTINVSNDIYGNPFTSTTGVVVNLALTNTPNWGFGSVGIGTKVVTITSGPATNTFTVSESGANKTTALTAQTLAPGFTAPGAFTMNSGN